MLIVSVLLDKVCQLSPSQPNSLSVILCYFVNTILEFYSNFCDGFATFHAKCSGTIQGSASRDQSAKHQHYSYFKHGLPVTAYKKHAFLSLKSMLIYNRKSMLFLSATVVTLLNKKHALLEIHPKKHAFLISIKSMLIGIA